MLENINVKVFGTSKTRDKALQALCVTQAYKDASEEEQERLSLELVNRTFLVSLPIIPKIVDKDSVYEFFVDAGLGFGKDAKALMSLCNRWLTVKHRDDYQRSTGGKVTAKMLQDFPLVATEEQFLNWRAAKQEGNQELADEIVRDAYSS